MSEKLGRFNHHPDPAIDFCVEVECLQAMAYDRSVNFDAHKDYERRLSAALDFRVGGDEIAVTAKETLRELGEIERLKQENSALAADQCHYGYGDEHGNHRCKYQDEIESLKAEIARLSKSPWRLIENHETPKDRPILLCNLDDGFSVVAEWENHYSLWRGAGQMRWPSSHFTHWCELPAPLNGRKS